MDAPKVTYAPLEKLNAHLQFLADPSRAGAMGAYMRGLFPFYGVPKPIRVPVFKEAFASLLQAKTNPHEVALWCWAQPQREWQYFGMEYFSKAWKMWQLHTPETIEQLVADKSWWDTVDFLSVHAAGKYFSKWPEYRGEWINRWRNCSNFWLVRMSILFQLQYKENTDTDLLFDICRQHAYHKEFFIQKAIGWALRSYAYTDAPAVIKFAASNNLSALSRREALKHKG